MTVGIWQLDRRIYDATVQESDGSRMVDLVPGLVAVVVVGDYGGTEWIRTSAVYGLDFQQVCWWCHFWVELEEAMTVAVYRSVKLQVMSLLNPYLVIARVPDSTSAVDSGVM